MRLLFGHAAVHVIKTDIRYIKELTGRETTFLHLAAYECAPARQTA